VLDGRPHGPWREPPGADDHRRVPAKGRTRRTLRACVAAWPYYANTTHSELDRISAKTRGLYGSAA